MKTWRLHPVIKPVKDSEAKEVVPTKIFDNVAFIGNESVCCFLVETSDGLLLLDCMCPENAEYIETCIRELGYDPADLKHILLTHGHGDHYGDAGYFQKKYGTRLYMSEVDEAFAHDPNNWRPPHRDYPMPFDMDGHLVAGQDFVCGDTAIKIYDTAGHTPGCLSFILPVYDDGKKHMAALFGGFAPPLSHSMIKTGIEKIDAFARAAFEEGVDVEISNHPFNDNAVARLMLMRGIRDCLPNPFVLGYENYRRYELWIRDIYEKRLNMPEQPMPATRGPANFVGNPTV